MDIFTKPRIKYQHLGRNKLKMACFQIWNGKQTRKKIFKVIKGYSISQHYQLLNEIPSHCVTVQNSLVNFMVSCQKY